MSNEAHQEPASDAHGDVDIDEDVLVGTDEEHDASVQPSAALMPGEADSLRVLIMWLVRKSFYWLFCIGYSVGVIAATFARREPQFDPQGGISWTWLILLSALALRFLAGWIALALATPIALAHRPNLWAGRTIATYVDRFHVLQAFRALRWTHGVRQTAQTRLGERGRRLGQIDRIIGIVNIASAVILVVTIIIYMAVVEV